jgi:hypothetical protein
MVMARTTSRALTIALEEVLTVAKVAKVIDMDVA